ncbi:hypothetical protein ABEB36_013763 [Hypothenemus hampei]|uniref:Uncharacterized protein n=1 Tax=Hypothenemus hampei TaxID=57062 RepID=A0ABD1E572_HYPHA
MIEEYNIDLIQVYSNITDNGANVIKCTKLLQEIQEQELLGYVHSQNAEQEDEEEELIHIQIESVLAVVRYAAHTLQLAAYDVMKTIEFEINQYRKAVKNLRSNEKENC